MRLIFANVIANVGRKSLATIHIKFQERIKELRTQKNMSQMDLALATGISQSAIAKCSPVGFML